MPIQAPDLEAGVARHYDTGPILTRIKAGLLAAGADPETPAPDDLKGVDEFHTGGIEATHALLEPLGISSDDHVLDVGSGIGGTARFVASRYGARVVGVDLTPAFVDVAGRLSAMCGLADRTRFEQGSALDLPLPDESFDLATMFHVGMNIADKGTLFQEIARVLAPGGRFALFDIMQTAEAPPDFPVPWATSAEQSHLAPPAVYREAARAAGLEPTAERDRSDFARDYFQRVIADADAKGGPPPVGLQLLMGDGAQERYANAVGAAMSGRTGPWEMVFVKAAG